MPKLNISEDDNLHSKNKKEFPIEDEYNDNISAKKINIGLEDGKEYNNGENIEKNDVDDVMTSESLTVSEVSEDVRSNIQNESIENFENENKGQRLNVPLIRTLRARKQVEDYDVDNLKRLLHKISQHERTKYIMAFKVKKTMEIFCFHRQKETSK